MFDFSLGKLLIVALIALIVLGPDKLPGAARTAGAMIRRLRASWDSVRSEVERELEVEEMRRAARQAAADAEAAQVEANQTLQQLNAELDKVRAARLELDASDAPALPEAAADDGTAPDARAAPAAAGAGAGAHAARDPH